MIPRERFPLTVPGPVGFQLHVLKMAAAINVPRSQELYSEVSLQNACSVFALWLVAYEKVLLYFLSQGTGWGNRTYARYK